MYLTRLRFDLRSSQARRDLGDPYEMHRTLVRSFVGSDTQTPPRFLWRLEPENAWNAPTVLVQSLEPANWSVLEQLPYYLKRAPETKRVDLVNLLQPQVRYRFRLHANPTVARNRKRFGLSSETAQLDWLIRQGLRFGFEVEAALVTSSDVLSGHKGGTAISLHRACFEGVLRIVDVQALSGALQGGIGPGKAFGCGLLSIARC